MEEKIKNEYLDLYTSRSNHPNPLLPPPPSMLVDNIKWVTISYLSIARAI